MIFLLHDSKFIIFFFNFPSPQLPSSRCATLSSIPPCFSPCHQHDHPNPIVVQHRQSTTAGLFLPEFGVVQLRDVVHVPGDPRLQLDALSVPDGRDEGRQTRWVRIPMCANRDEHPFEVDQNWQSKKFKIKKKHFLPVFWPQSMLPAWPKGIVQIVAIVCSTHPHGSQYAHKMTRIPTILLLRWHHHWSESIGVSRLSTRFVASVQKQIKLFHYYFLCVFRTLNSWNINFMGLWASSPVALRYPPFI